MTSSGIEVDEELKATFNRIKQLGKNNNLCQLLVMEITPDKKKVKQVTEFSEATCSYDKFRKFFSDEGRKKRPCFVVYDYMGSLFLIKWNPDDAQPIGKMIYASTFAEVKRACEGVKYIMEATELAELAKDILDGKVGKSVP